VAHSHTSEEKGSSSVNPWLEIWMRMLTMPLQMAAELGGAHADARHEAKRRIEDCVAELRRELELYGAEGLIKTFYEKGE